MTTRRMKYKLLTTAFYCLTGLGSMALLIPIASVLAGEQTGVNVSVSVAFSLAMTGVSAGFASAYRRERKKASASAERARDLSARLQAAQSDLRSSDRRNLELTSDLERSREDCEALRTASSGGQA